jgi:hypothetical protein
VISVAVEIRDPGSRTRAIERAVDPLRAGRIAEVVCDEVIAIWLHSNWYVSNDREQLLVAADAEAPKHEIGDAVAFEVTGLRGSSLPERWRSEKA